ncbi:polysaccharide pyruvyl transferase family protein [Bacteroides congonensis]
MKIAILTQPLYTNYGGILQAYAVQKILRNMGHEVVTLDIPYQNVKYKCSLYTHIRLFFTTLLLFLLNRLKAQDIVWPYNTRKRNRKLISHSMHPFIKRIIRLSPTLESESAIKYYIKEQNFDAYFVGSDQVWRLMYSPNISWYFLSFLPEDTKVKRIALSASFGISDWEYSKEQTDYLKPFAKRFDAISVREISGVDLCQKYLGVQAIQVIDPTMMLTHSDYVQLVDMDVQNTQSMRGGIFSYVLDESVENQMFLNYISKELELPVMNLEIEKHKYGPYASKKKAMQYAPKSVSQWLRGFQETELVVTDSFHGTVFSILHHRPFVVVGNKTRGLARIETLLSIFDLEDRLIETATNCSKEWLLNGIQWEKVNIILEEKREIFKSFIDNALEKYV